jgi:hypothetical protein
MLCDGVRRGYFHRTKMKQKRSVLIPLSLCDDVRRGYFHATKMKQ